MIIITKDCWKICSYRVFIKYCVFLKDFKILRTLAFLCFLSVSVCVHTPGTHQAGRTPALQQNWQSSENSKNFKEKHNISWTPSSLVRKEWVKKAIVKLLNTTNSNHNHHCQKWWEPIPLPHHTSIASVRVNNFIFLFLFL